MRKILCLLLLSTLITPAFAADWSMFKNDVSHSGYTTDAVNPPLTLKWTKDLGFETDSSPVIVNDVLYIGTAFGISALDAKTGQELWKYHTDGFVKSVPAVSNGVVYIGADDKKFYAIDAKDGTLIWMNDTALNGYTASAAVVGNLVYAIPKDGTFYAFDSSNGKIVWSTLVGKIAESSPAIGEGIIAFGSDGGTIIALDAVTGKEKWIYDAGVSDIMSSPVIADGAIFIGSNDGSVYAITADKGALKWKFSTGDNVESSPSVKNGVVYFGSQDSNFFAVDEGTGQLKWKFPYSGAVLSAPAISNDVVYFGTETKVIYGLDANTGELIWRNSTGKNDKDYITSPAVSGNVLYAATHSGIVYAYSSGLEAVQTPTMTSTPATTSIVTSSATPVSTPKPEQTKKSPGFEYPVFILLIMLAIGIYKKKK
ncbi:MAG: PQQ-binding-like beta-propeller repeat protein [Candidatus Methanoperedens sp.]|nr:PQQ-binding-like beta-propeller repeat protein [Candidatus Methanoperedens sp.]